MKKAFLFVAALIVSFSFAIAQTPKSYTWDPDNLATMRTKALAKDPSVATLVNAMVSTAGGYVNRVPVSVVDKVDGWQVYFPASLSVTPNEYVSFSIYYWPVAGHETDGTPWVINENAATGGGANSVMRNKFDYPRLQVMQGIVITCAKAYWVTNDVKYAKAAAAQIRTWFLTPGTRMLPQLEHAQFGPFTTSYAAGSPYGMIDLMEFHNIFNSIELIRNSGEWTAADDAAMKQWMYDFTQWMTTSAFGIKEGTKINNNNHGIYYDVLLLTQYLYLGTYNGVDYVQKAKDYLLTISTDYRITYLTKGTVSGTTTVVDGGMWKELSRSGSAGYEEMCMRGYTYLSNIARKVNIDLLNWNYEAAGNQSIREALEWNIPYFENPSTWTFGNSATSASLFLADFWVSSTYIPSHVKLFNNYVLTQTSPTTFDAHEYNLLYPRPLYYYDDFVSIVNPAMNRTTFRGGTWATSAGELQLSAPAAALTNNTPGNICLNTATVSKDYSAIANLKLTSIGASDGVGLVFMATCTAGTAENYYYVLLSNNASESGIYKVKGNNSLTGTVRTKLADISTAISPNTVYNLKVTRNVGTTSVFLNDVKVAEMTDTEFISGKTGFCTQNGTASILDVRITKTAANMLPFVTHITTNQNQIKVSTGGSFKISADAIDYDGTITKVEYFNGTTKLGESLTAPYSYNYTNIPKGISLIKVVATDNSGGQSSVQFYLYTDTAPTAVSQPIAESNIQVYPNPSKGTIYFNGLEEDTAQVNVYDLTGKHVMQTSVSNNEAVQMDGMKNGIFVLSILSNEQLINKKIVLCR